MMWPPTGAEAPSDRTIGQRWAHFEASAGLSRLAALQDSVAGLAAQLSAAADAPETTDGAEFAVTAAARALGGLAPLLRLAAGGLQVLALQVLRCYESVMVRALGFVDSD